MAGYYSVSGKNPDKCEGVAEACVPFVAFVFDTDHDEFLGANDGVFFLDYGLNGFLAVVAKGNLSITSESVPTSVE